MTKELSVLLFVIAFGGGVLSVVLKYYIEAYTRKNHASKWRDLGEPGFLNDSIQNSTKFGSYFLRGTAYKELEDPRLNRFVGLAKVVGIISFSALLATIFVVYLTR